MRELTCPSCGRRFVSRSRRTGPFERMLGVIGLFPFRCQLCRRRFWRRTPGGGHREVDASNRREYERLPARVLIGIQWGDQRHDATLQDVSIAGGTLETGAAIPPGVLIQLTLEPSDRGQVVQVSKAVVRSSRAGRLGVQFVDVDDQERHRLTALVEGLLEQRRP